MVETRINSPVGIYKEEILRNLEEERKRQIFGFIRLGFDEELKDDKEKYFNSFPEIRPQPKEYEGYFDTLLLIDPRIPLKRQCELAGITSRINTYRVINKTNVPDKPYAIWTHDAQAFRSHLPRTQNAPTVRSGVRGLPRKDKVLKPDHIGSPLIEVINLYIHHPEFFKDHGSDAPGSRYTDGYVPFLDIIRGKPRVYTAKARVTDERWGELTRGKEISGI